MKIKDLPLTERPREKAKRFGFQTLSNAELLALIIGSGTRGHSSLEIANDILLDSGGIKLAFNKNYHDLLTYKGINESSALKLEACFYLVHRYLENEAFLDANNINASSIYKRYYSLLKGEKNESLHVIILNRSKHIVYETMLAPGTESAVNLPLENLFSLLLIHRAKYFYLVHNHPFSACGPSEADDRLTLEISRSVLPLGFKLLDHIIVGEDGYYSYFESQSTYLFK